MKSIVFFLYTVANFLIFFCHISYAQNNYVMDVQLEAIPKEVRIYEEDTATYKLFLSKPATRSLKIVEHPDWMDVSLEKPFISNDTVVLKVFKNEQFERPIGLTSFLKLETEDSQLDLYLMLIPKKYGHLKLYTDSIHFKSYESSKRIDFVSTLGESYRIKACSKEKWIEFGKEQNYIEKFISSMDCPHKSRH